VTKQKRKRNHLIENEDENEEIKDSFKFRNENTPLSLFLNDNPPAEPIITNPEMKTKRFKKSFNTKDMRVIDEDTLKIVNIEFILK